MAETILIVDDEESVRRTLYEWLRDVDAECELFQASDAESALRIASQRPIDLAVLDWNLGAGHNGLQLLEDLRVFAPEIVAILVTGYAQQATPLDALRMGVRDYLDKSRDLRRETLLAIVRRQLAQIRPAKRQREHWARVQQFRQAIETILPLVRTTTELSMHVPVSESLQALLRLAQALGQTDQGVLIVKHPPSTSASPAASAGAAQAPADSESLYSVLNLQGQTLRSAQTGFSDTLAAATLALQEICILPDLTDAERRLQVHLQDYERGHGNLLALAVPLEHGYAAVLELFDTPLAEQVWNETQRACWQSLRQLAASVLGQAFAEHQLHTILLRALESALQSSSGTALTEPGRATVPDWRTLLAQPGLLPEDAEELSQLAERLHTLYRKYGRPAAQFCHQLLHQLEELLSQLLGPPTSSP